LTPRYRGEGFTELVLSIDDATKMVRRINARTIADAELEFNFTNTRVNQGIPEQRFLYDSPASANVYNNFLFRDTE
jgi:outer membrane lipoprotein-sorting protein